MKTVNKISLKVISMLLLFSICILCFAGCSKQGDYVAGSFQYNIYNNSNEIYVRFDIKPEKGLVEIEYKCSFFDIQGNLIETKSEKANVNSYTKKDIITISEFLDSSSANVSMVELTDIKYYYTTEWLYGLIGGIAAGALLALAIVIFVKSKRKETGK